MKSIRKLSGVITLCSINLSFKVDTVLFLFHDYATEF